MKKKVTIKARNIIFFIVAFLLCAAIVKLLYVSISSKIDGKDLRTYANNRNEKTKILQATRGAIYDRNGDTLASSVNSYTLIAYLDPKRTTDPSKPKHVVDKITTAKELAKVIDLSEDKILEILSKNDQKYLYQVEFGSKGKNLTEIQKKSIEDLELPGIDFTVSTQRYYKMGDFASYIIGYAKSNDKGEIKGELGIESYFNNDLSGTNGYQRYQSDAYGYALPNSPVVSEEAINGKDIYLTIDSNIQLICENAVHNASKDYKSDFIVLTIMDAKTGAIVASATSPSFNPNDLNTLESYLNPLVSYTFEPGSTMKIFSWAAAMEEGIYNGDATFKSGSIEVADVVINDFERKGWGTISYDTGFVYSANTGATQLALALGRDKMYTIYERFGFGRKTGIELSGELAGDANFKYKSELATASFGQGISVTPIQLLQALTMITNDGEELKPYIVDKIVDNNGKITYEGARDSLGFKMKKETTDKLKTLMYDVVYKGLTKAWQPSKVHLAGKTGTAQIASPKGGYLSGQYDYVYSFAGFFPYEEPKYIIYAASKKFKGPKKQITDMVAKTVDEISAYESLISTEEEKVTSIKVDNYVSKTVPEEINNLNRIVIGDGNYVIKQYPVSGTNVVKNSKIYLVTNSTNIIMPDLKGWSLSDVKTFAILSNKSLSYSGYGYVSEQNIPPGTIIENTIIDVKLTN